VTADGEALSTIHRSPDWPPGSIIYRGSSEPHLRVLDRLDYGNPDPEKFAILIVEET
jgi:hypothetical protein